MSGGVLHESGLVTEGISAVLASAVEVSLMFPVNNDLVHTKFYDFTVVF